MPPSSAAKKSSGISFMPKGSSFSRNIRRTKEEDIQPENHFLEDRKSVLREDFNESSNSDDGSKYSYEDSGDDIDKGFSNKNLYEGIGSIVSPPLSLYESPDALDINSLVQLNSKVPHRLNVSTKSSPLHTLSDIDGPPSLSLRKIGQPTSLKPLQTTQIKSASPKKKSKNLKKANLSKYDPEETENTACIEEKQNLMLKNIQNEWAAKQEEFEKEQKTKYEQVVKENSKMFEEEEALIRKEHSDRLSKLKNEQEKKIEVEKQIVEKNLAEIKKTNELIYNKEEQEFKEKLGLLTEAKNVEINDMKEKNNQDVTEKKMQLNMEMEAEIELLKTSQENKLKELKDSHFAELELVEKAHSEKMIEINLNHSNAENILAHEKENNLHISDNVQLELKKQEQLLNEKREQHQKLSAELSSLEDKVKVENAAILKLEEKLATAQAYYEEIQDEVDKTENDLDLLRGEKSALISELNILKENVNNEKSNLLNIEMRQETKVSSPKRRMLNCENKSVNTEGVITTLCQATQTNIDFKDAFCQISEVSPPKQDMSSQTYEVKLNTFDKSCQVQLIAEDTSLNGKNNTQNKCPSTDANESSNINVLINKSLENLLSNVTDKMDERFKAIEKDIWSLSQNMDSSENKVSSGILNRQVTNSHLEAQTSQNIYDFNTSDRAAINDTFVVDASKQNVAFSSQKTCSCVQGDSDSCGVMQELKSSAYRLNDIINTSNNVMPQFSQLLSSSSSPLDTFYAQFRQLQEKHRVINLKHKCQNEVKINFKGSSDVAPGTNQLKNNFNKRNYSGNIENSNIYAIEFPEDALIRARNLVLKEKARSWKQSQLQNSSFSSPFAPSENHFSISDNVSHSVSSRTSPGLSETSPSSQYPFVNFESDRASDYNSWMLRLNTLQQRIRSHKFL